MRGNVHLVQAIVLPSVLHVQHGYCFWYSFHGETFQSYHSMEIPILTPAMAVQCKRKRRFVVSQTL